MVAGYDYQKTSMVPDAVKHGQDSAVQGAEDFNLLERIFGMGRIVRGLGMDMDQVEFLQPLKGPLKFV